MEKYCRARLAADDSIAVNGPYAGVSFVNMHSLSRRHKRNILHLLMSKSNPVFPVRIQKCMIFSPGYLHWKPLAALYLLNFSLDSENIKKKMLTNIGTVVLSNW